MSDGHAEALMAILLVVFVCVVFWPACAVLR